MPPKCANHVHYQRLKDHRDSIDKEKNPSKWFTANKACRGMLNHRDVLMTIEDAIHVEGIGPHYLNLLKKWQNAENGVGTSIASGSSSRGAGSSSTSPKKRGRARKEDESVASPRPVKRAASDSTRRASVSQSRLEQRDVGMRSSSAHLPLASTTGTHDRRNQRLSFWYIDYETDDFGRPMKSRRVHENKQATLRPWAQDDDCWGYVVEILDQERHQDTIKAIWMVDQGRVFGYLPMELAEEYPTSPLPLDNIPQPTSSISRSESRLLSALSSLDQPSASHSVPSSSASRTTSTATSTSVSRQSTKTSVKGKERMPLFLPSDDDKDEGHKFGTPNESILGRPPSPPASRAPSVASQRQTATSSRSLPALSRSRTMPDVGTASNASTSRPTAPLARSTTIASTRDMPPLTMPSSSQRAGRTQFDAPAPVVPRGRGARLSEHVPNLPVETGYNEIGNYISFKANHKFMVPVPQKLDTGTYDIILVLDNRERTDGMCEQLRTKGIRVMQKALAIADVAWIAKKKERYFGNGQPDEVALDAVVERKRIDDLFSSIHDGRFHEQKFRLHQSGITRVYYVVEQYARSLTRPLEESSIKAVNTALSSTACVDCFMVEETKSIKDTVDYYAYLHYAVQEVYRDQTLLVIPDHLVKRYNYLEYQDWLRNTCPDLSYLTTYETFNHLNSKSGFTTIRTSFAKGLLTINGLSAEKAGLLIEGYPYSKALWNFFRNEQQREARELEEERRNPQLGGTGGRPFGVKLSEKVYDLLMGHYGNGEDMDD